MTYRLRFSKKADRQYRGLPKSVRDRLAPRIESLSRDPRPPGVKFLSGSHGVYRLRVGDYRIVYAVDDPGLTILVVKLGHRREVYR